MIDEFYVYQLRVEGESLPFYVGKGKGRRAWDHINRNDNEQSHKANKIRKAIGEGKEILIEYIKKDLTEAEAFSLEMESIAKYGRYDLGTGPLTNKTDGGEGISGLSEETRNKIAEALRGKVLPDWHKEKISNAMKGWVHTDEHRLNNSNARRGIQNTEEQKRKISASMSGKPKTAEHALNISLGKMGVKPSDEAKKKMASSKAKNWLIINPDGIEMTISNLKEFCLANGLNASMMAKVANGLTEEHRGYRCRRVD